MMTKAEVEQARERAEKATPGPWIWEDWFHEGGGEGPNRQTLTAPPDARGAPSKMFPDLRVPVVSGEEPPENADDAAFIAAARSDVPALAATVEALAEALRRCEEAIHHAAPGDPEYKNLRRDVAVLLAAYDRDTEGR